MRKGLFTLILAIVSGACTWVHAQTIVLSESFENGMPAGWTQETVIGSTSWTTEASAVGTLLYPEGTASGIGRAVLRNETGETQGFKTRLITPWMNLDTVFQPILRYYHAQVKWTGDIDTLRAVSTALTACDAIGRTGSTGLLCAAVGQLVIQLNDIRDGNIHGTVIHTIVAGGTGNRIFSDHPVGDLHCNRQFLLIQGFNGAKGL